PTDASKANPLATFILDITDSKVPVNAKELSFRPKLAGRSYRVMKSNDLGQTNAWTPLTAVPSDAPVPGAPGVFESKVTDTNATQRTATYRIEINLNQ
ncbi:MAG: hypothetical protein R3F19_17590, partial [Verrucomicrobiales bacterium]